MAFWQQNLFWKVGPSWKKLGPLNAHPPEKILHLRPCLGSTLPADLQKLQNRAARVVTNSPFDHASLPLISKLGWLTVNEMIDFETACMVYKALHGLAPPYMKSMFQKLSESCNRTLRNTSTDLRIPLCKTSNGQRSFSYRGVTVWNQLSLEQKTAPSLAAFKTKLKSFLKDQRS